MMIIMIIVMIYDDIMMGVQPPKMFFELGHKFVAFRPGCFGGEQ